MEVVEIEKEEAEIIPDLQICPRHGARIRRYFGCPRCVIEEVRRHEKRMDAAFRREEPVAALHEQGSAL